MGRIILVTGGSRSGKSALALKLAENEHGERVFVATCPVTDDEMRTRVDRHKQDREGCGWKTIEEQTELADAIAASGDAGVVLVDCLTLWVNNLMYHAEKQGLQIDEKYIESVAIGVLEACAGIAATVIFVTNEVGMGIVPGDAVTRLFRDLAGRCNQVIAGGADTVMFSICGCALTIK